MGNTNVVDIMEEMNTSPTSTEDELPSGPVYFTAKLSYNPKMELTLVRSARGLWRPDLAEVDPEANDLVCHIIGGNGVWEPLKTECMHELASDSTIEGIAVDVGSHVGYYSAMMASCGRETHSFDFVETYMRAYRSTRDNSGEIGQRMHLHVADLNVDPRIVARTIGNQKVALLKMDIEGFEPKVMFAGNLIQKFRERNIEAAVIEISPSFGLPPYEDLIRAVIDCGYDAVDIGVSPDRAFCASTHHIRDIRQWLTDTHPTTCIPDDLRLETGEEVAVIQDHSLESYHGTDDTIIGNRIQKRSMFPDGSPRQWNCLFLKNSAWQTMANA